ncbi:MAG: peptidylprolyl isomerase [Flammeovirgaceae bacterium]|nr:peptidylprolyl isomerase [Flammeovirgaceae bacterium]MDW8288356.1 peptidylprolyl isomerase [Flammeovirgaceae bacterium]
MKKALTLLLIGICFNAFAQKKPWKPHARKDCLVLLKTDFGEILLLLYDETPRHKANFIELVSSGYYDGMAFHRVLEGFAIQGGDPYTKQGADSTKIGYGTAGEDLEAEIIPTLKHKRGTLGAARKDDQINPERRSSKSQFYIIHAAEGAPHLDGKYTIFGEVLKGMHVVDLIAAQEVGKYGLPKRPIRFNAKTVWMKRKEILKKQQENS